MTPEVPAPAVPPRLGRPVDRFAAAKAVADAVLYEGYVLYPYRASARKNQVRWQFGVLTPRAFSESDGSERWSMRTECLARPLPDGVLHARIRFLHLQRRVVLAPCDQAPAVDGFVPVGSLEIEGAVYLAWDEAVDETVEIGPLALGDLYGPGHQQTFHLPGRSETEILQRQDGGAAGRLVRTREALDGQVVVAAHHLSPSGLARITVEVQNRSDWADPGATRDDALTRSLIAAHTALAIEGGTFVSLLDPPAGAEEAAAACHSDGTYPVLIGGDDVVLSAPIILYDHPEVAPESPGELYDGTEIDEILALRVLTLTDGEKAEARVTDPRAAAVIDRCDDLPPEVWERLHGAVRSIGPAAEPNDVPWWDPGQDASVDPAADSVIVAGREVRQGSAVRLRPSHRADAQDLFLQGLTAKVAAVFRDVDDNEYVAVTVDDDPAAEELEWQGRYLYFYPDELEPLSSPEGGP
jgi:hypothetical protein